MVIRNSSDGDENISQMTVQVTIRYYSEYGGRWDSICVVLAVYAVFGGRGWSFGMCGLWWTDVGREQHESALNKFAKKTVSTVVVKWLEVATFQNTLKTASAARWPTASYLATAEFQLTVFRVYISIFSQILPSAEWKRRIKKGLLNDSSASRKDAERLDCWLAERQQK